MSKPVHQRVLEANDAPAVQIQERHAGADRAAVPGGPGDFATEDGPPGSLPLARREPSLR